MASVLLLAEQFGGSIHTVFDEHVTTHLGRVGGYILERSPLEDGPTGTYRFPISRDLASKQFARTYGALQPPGQSLSSATYPNLKDAWHQLSSGKEVSLSEMCIQKPDDRAEMISFELFSN